MKRERQRKDTRIRLDEEGPSISYQQQRKLENHKSTMPTFFEGGEMYRNEEIRGPETHETLSLYLEEYNEQYRAFKERLTL